MGALWSTLNRGLNAIFDLVLWPFSALPPSAQAIVLAIPATVFALLVFRWVSDQAGIERAKDQIKAHLLELRLFQDDLGVTLRAQGQILRHNLTYLRHAVLPMLVMIGPIVLLLIQVESRFAFRALEPGETAILRVEVDDGKVSRLSVGLEVPSGLSVETPPLRADTRGEVSWRIRAEAPGDHVIDIRVGAERVRKRAVVSGPSGISPSIYRANDLATLTYPAEDALPDDVSIRAVHLTYPRDRAEFAGLSSASWIFFAATLVLGFALRGLFGVTF